MKRSGKVKSILYFSGVLVLLITAVVFVRIGKSEFLTPLKLVPYPLRAGDRVFLLTGQWKTKIHFHSGSSSGFDAIRTTDMLLELWCFDARSAVPKWRKRLLTERDGAMYGYKLLGAQGDLVWITTPRGPMAASMSDGTIRATAASLEATNPELKGLVPKEQQFYTFDRQGLLMTAADARKWRLDPATLRGQQASEGADKPATDVLYPTYMAPNSTTAFVSRSLPLPGRWLGLLTEKEVESFRRTNTVGDLDVFSRRRLYGSNGVPATNFFGKYFKYEQFKPLGKDYLGPGLLSYHRPTGPYDVVWLRNPDSVLVLHRDRLGEEGKLRLTRVAGPEGRVVWEVALPLSVLQSALPGQDSVVLYGVEFTPPADNHPRDPLNSALERLVGIDMVDGRVHVHDQSDVDHHIHATPENTP